MIVIIIILISIIIIMIAGIIYCQSKWCENIQWRASVCVCVCVWSITQSAVRINAVKYQSDG